MGHRLLVLNFPCAPDSSKCGFFNLRGTVEELVDLQADTHFRALSEQN